MPKKLMMGNEAVARGLYEAGVRFVSSYPGTPSTEITEFAAEYDEIYAEWAPNEKVACEAAFGASMAGSRSFAGMKHVGLNVAADLLFTVSYTGINAGFVIAVADDMGMHSSQNEQDSRHYAIAAKVPMLEPSDSNECREFVKKAYALSEAYDTPVLLRLMTRVSHSQSAVELEERLDTPAKEYSKNPAKYVMMPAYAKGRHVVVEKRQLALQAAVETDEINQIIPGGGEIGIIAAGIAFQYAREALGDKASYLKLGIVNPLPVEKIKSFAKSVKKLYVIEELDDIIEAHCRKNGIEAEGKNLFSNIGEYTAEAIRNKILGTPLPETNASEIELPGRPPVLCPGCPHRGLFYTLRKIGALVYGDIGCYTLGALPPLSAMDLVICMGASVSGLHGMNIAGGPEFSQKSVAVIGDSTFCHSGITGLLNIVYNQSPSTVIIADNSITGMTGHQQNPCTGLTLKNTPAPALDLEALCRALGVRRVFTSDPFDLNSLETLIRQELAEPEPSVIIAKQPCALLKTVKKEKPLVIRCEKCRKCKACMKIGCPAIAFDSIIGAQIDASLCSGCSLCMQLCTFGAIERQAD